MNYLCYLLIIFLSANCTHKNRSKSALKLSENENIKQIFENYNRTNDSFVVYHKNNEEIIGYNLQRANKRFIPGSTFKIPNTVIALSEKIITNINQIFYYYNGQEVFLDVWTNNMSLKEAFKTSNVPAFQEIATSIGLTKMKEYINKFEYGNQNIGNIIDRFWLDGPLEISSIEQIVWLDKLLDNKFNTDSSVIDRLYEIAYIENINDHWKLYGKTGWANKAGWFIGWIEKNNNRFIFAINLNIEESKDLPLREIITKEILNKIINSSNIK